MERKKKNLTKKGYLNYFPKLKAPWKYALWNFGFNFQDAHRNYSPDNAARLLSFFHHVFHCDSYENDQNDHDNYVVVFVQSVNSTT